MYLRRIYRFSCTNPNLAAIYVLKNPLMMNFRHISFKLSNICQSHQALFRTALARTITLNERLMLLDSREPFSGRILIANTFSEYGVFRNQPKDFLSSLTGIELKLGANTESALFAVYLNFPDTLTCSNNSLNSFPCSSSKMCRVLGSSVIDSGVGSIG